MKKKKEAEDEDEDEEGEEEEEVGALASIHYLWGLFHPTVVFGPIFGWTSWLMMLW